VRHSVSRLFVHIGERQASHINTRFSARTEGPSPPDRSGPPSNSCSTWARSHQSR